MGDRGRTAATAAVVALLALAGAPAAQASTCAGADRDIGQLAPDAVTTAVVCVVNDVRQRRGLAPLALDARLQWAARRHSASMARTRTLRHAAKIAGGSGYRSAALGENVARGQRTPTQVVRAWLRSGPHCRNLMAPGYVHTGIAVRRAFWTQTFGRPAGTGRGGKAKPCRLVLDRELRGGKRGGKAGDGLALPAAADDGALRVGVPKALAGRTAELVVRTTPACVLRGTIAGGCEETVQRQALELTAPATAVALPAVPAGGLVTVRIAVDGVVAERQYR